MTSKMTSQAPRVSLVMPTARTDYPYVSIPDYIFKPTFDSLSQQTFKDFELVIADCCHQYRGNIEDKCATLHIKYKHVPVHSPFLDRKMVTIATAINTAIRHSSGELIIHLDDGCWLPPDWIEKIWLNYKQFGLWTLSVFKPVYDFGKSIVKGVNEYDYLKNVVCNDYQKERYAALFKVNEQIEDTRHKYLVEHKMNRWVGCPPQWFYGFSSFPRQVWNELDGYDEAMDGTKSLEDVELGTRIGSKYPNKFVIQADIWCLGFALKGYDTRVVDIAKNFKCNYGILQYNQLTGRKANSLFTLEQIKELEGICKVCGHAAVCAKEELKAEFKIDCEEYEYWKSVVTTAVK